MTDQIDQIDDSEVDDLDDAVQGRNKRRMFIAGAGLAGAAALVGKSGVASAADGATYTGSTTTYQNDESNGGTPGTAGNEAIVGEVLEADNGSHAIRGVTNGTGHSIAGDTPASAPNTVAATWGRHAGLGAGIGGVNTNPDDVPIAGSARGVEGVVTAPTNGSHAVFGATNGGGHSVAGDTPADAAGPGGVGPNTTAATWGRHGGVGAGIGGISANGYGGEFKGGKAQARLIPEDDAAVGKPTGDDHLRGEMYVDGAGDLWYNQSDGENWVGLTKGSTILWADPQRATDTRAGTTPPNADKTPYSAGETREVDLSTLVPDFPATASAALVNLTVVNTDGQGFATLFNGDTDDADRPNTSNINWDVDTSVIANSATVRANAEGVIKVYTSKATDVIIDIQGYIA